MDRRWMAGSVTNLLGRGLRRRGLLAALAVLLAIGRPWPPATAEAASFTVTSTADAPHSQPLNGNCTSTLPGNPCTLRAAMQAANFLGGGPHTISLPAGTYTLTIPFAPVFDGATGSLFVGGSATVQIVGAGAASTIVQAGPTPGSGSDRVFTAIQAATLSIQGVTIRHGTAQGCINDVGGGILVNKVAGFADPTLILDRVVVADNTSDGGGSGMKVEGIVKITNSAVIGNGPSEAIECVCLLTMVNVTVSDNGNPSDNGATGLRFNPALPGTSTVTNVTIVGNGGYGIHLSGDEGEGDVIVKNSIIANNTGPSGPNCLPLRLPISGGHNLSNTSECGFSATGDQLNTDPKLGPLQSNGSPMPSHVPLPGSPAIDKGNPATPGGADPNACPAKDPRGLARPQDGDNDGGTRCDIGAVEVPRFLVTSTADAVDAEIGNFACKAANSECTLRAAVQEGNALGGATVSVPPGEYNLTLTGAGEDAAEKGDLDLTGGLTILGKAATIDGRGLDRVFDVRSGAVAVLRGLVIRRGGPGSTQSGGGLRVGDGASLTLFESAVVGNVAGSGGALASSGTLAMTNVTLSGNRVNGQGGGLLTTAGRSSLVNVTVASNTAASGGGVSRGGGTLEALNSLLANNIGGNCGGTILSQGNNLDSANTCNFASTPGDGDLINADPMLGPLKDNGGNTLTHGLPKDSPAIDAGNNTGCPTQDQRGIARPQDGDGNGLSRCDIGAFELQPGAVGTFSLVPRESEVDVGERLRLVLTWTVPAPKGVDGLEVGPGPVA